MDARNIVIKTIAQKNIKQVEKVVESRYRLVRSEFGFQQRQQQKERTKKRGHSKKNFQHY